MSHLEINRPIRKVSASSVSLSGEESFPNPTICLLDVRTQRTTRSLYVDQKIYGYFKEFGNTDMLPVLPGILAFKTFRYKAETLNQMISPYIEQSLSMPLRYKNMDQSKLKYISAFKNVMTVVSHAKVHCTEKRSSSSPDSILSPPAKRMKHEVSITVGTTILGV